MGTEHLVERIREDFERGNVDTDLLIRSYHAAYPLGSPIDNAPDLRAAEEEVVRDILARFPVQACGIAAEYLRRMLGKGTIVAGMFHDHHHRILLLDNRKIRIADITADQFGGPKTYVGPLVSPWYFD